MLRNSLLIQKGIKVKKDSKEKMIDLQKKTFKIPKDWYYSFATVTEDYIARPDLIAWTAYGNDSYGDLICKINGISNPLELNEGDIIILPDLNDIQKFYTKDDIKDDDEVMNIDGTSSNKPKQKSKKDKRKPNEAIMGDVRYRIDSTQKVVVY